MKRLGSLLVLGTAALLVPLSLHAQRGMSGGHSSGGFSRGGSGFHSAAPSGFRSSGGGFRSSPGFRSGGGFRSAGPAVRSSGFTSFSGGPGFASGGRGFASGRFASGRFGSRNHVFFNRPFGFNRFGFNRFGFNGPFGFRRFRPFPFFDGCFGCFSPFFFSSGLFLGSPFYPFGGYPFGGDYYGDYGYGGQPTAPPVVVNSDNGNSGEMAAEVQRLTDEVDDLRSEESRRYADDRARAANSGASMTAKEPVTTVFIFRDGRRISAQSYAIAGPTLWIFSEQAARKYQISDLDVSATEQTNAANGVEFHLPQAH